MLLIVGVGFQRVSVVVAAALESAALTALIAAVAPAGIVFGALYAPEALIVPTVALPPTIAFTNQLTF
jgi:hypothetical protein